MKHHLIPAVTLLTALILISLPPSHGTSWSIAKVAPGGELIDRIDGDHVSDCIRNYEVPEGQEIRAEGITTRFVAKFYGDDNCQTDLWDARYDGQLRAQNRTSSLKVVMQGWQSKKVEDAIREQNKTEQDREQKGEVEEDIREESEEVVVEVEEII